MMVEGEMKEVAEQDLIGALKAAAEAIKPMCELQYEKEAKQSEGQAKETASSDDASKTQANTEKENVSSEQTNEKESA